MASVGAFAAKTHFAQLLDRVEQGERITILRHGKPVAELTPVTPAPPIADVVEEILALRRKQKVILPAGSIQRMIRAGRQH